MLARRRLRGENPEDHDDDQDLDQREALVLSSGGSIA
jgi:hypothetical protein